MYDRPPRDSRINPWQQATPKAAEAPAFDRRAQRQREVRIFGVAACAAVADDRFEAIRKVYVNRARAKSFGDLLARLAASRVGYNLIEDADLERLTASQHHEGIALDIERKAQPSLATLKVAWQSAPRAVALALVGVGNPHNVGAILRSAVHFGASAVLMQRAHAVNLSGAVYRVAEGAAERIAVTTFDDIGELRIADMPLLATTTSGERSLFSDALPPKAIVLIGAEGPGLPADVAALAQARLTIPGTGRVDSLNVAQAATLVLAEWWRSGLRRP